MYFDSECQFIINSTYDQEIFFKNSNEENIFNHIKSTKKVTYESILKQFPAKETTSQIIYHFVKNNVFYCLPNDSISNNHIDRLFINLQDFYSQRLKTSEIPEYSEEYYEQSHKKYIDLIKKSRKYHSSFHKSKSDIESISNFLNNNKDKSDKKEEYLLDLLEKRYSCREYKKYLITLEQISQIFHISSGIGKNGHRMVGSGGAFYPIEIWGFVMDSKNPDLKNSIIHYNVKKNSIEIYQKEKNLREIIKELSPGHYGSLENASMFILLTSNLKYFIQKYGDFAYTLSLIESGMIAQNIVLAALKLKLQSLIIGGIHEFEYIELLKLKIPFIVPLLGITIGKKSDNKMEFLEYSEFNDDYVIVNK